MSDKYYTENHEWIEKIQTTYQCGISDHAQKLLSDLVYVELPFVDQQVNKGESIGVLESVKAAADIYAPVTGRITKINEDVVESPEIINHHPETKGWLFEIIPSEPSEIEQLMSMSDYQNRIQNNA